MFYLCGCICHMDGPSTSTYFFGYSFRYKEVAYLDTDVGQPEFTAPGCVSLHILDSPVVGKIQYIRGSLVLLGSLFRTYEHGVCMPISTFFYFLFFSEFSMKYVLQCV